MDIREDYFCSYEDFEVHRLMLDDAPRTLAYQRAILDNKDYFKDKVVMDVGCGTGILSIFCAQAGAKKVYAVEASSLANVAKDIVKENKFEEVIEVIHSKVEDVVLPNHIKVDALVSEWMGFYLLHEGMLDSVLFARHKFLKEGGEMFPESATIYVAPCSIQSLYKKWDNVYGVSMSAFGKQLRASKCNKPEILTISADELLGEKVAMCWINLKEDLPEDLDSYSIQHVVGANKSGSNQGVCVWFDCVFPELSSEVGREVLSTAPSSPETHWKQTVIVLPDEQEVEAAEPIAFQLDMKRDVLNGRRYRQSASAFIYYNVAKEPYGPLMGPGRLQLHNNYKYNLQLTMLDPNEAEHPLPCSCDMTKCILIKTFMKQSEEHAMENKAAENPGVLVEDTIDDDDGMNAGDS